MSKSTTHAIWPHKSLAFDKNRGVSWYITKNKENSQEHKNKSVKL